MDYMSNGMKEIVRTLVRQFRDSHPAPTTPEQRSDYRRQRRDFVQNGLQVYLRAHEEEALVRAYQGAAEKEALVRVHQD